LLVVTVVTLEAGAVPIAGVDAAFVVFARGWNVAGVAYAVVEAALVAGGPAFGETFLLFVNGFVLFGNGLATFGNTLVMFGGRFGLFAKPPILPKQAENHRKQAVFRVVAARTDAEISPRF
jgi:hypothetical protein